MFRSGWERRQGELMPTTGRTLFGEPLMTLAVRPHRFEAEPNSVEVAVEDDGEHSYLTCGRCARRGCHLCEDIWDEECEG